MATDTARRATWRAWLGLAVLTLPVLMTATDMTVLFLALPSIAADLEPGSTQMLWILHADAFLAVGFALTMGRLSERVGARRLLLVGVAVYGVASLAAAFSPTPEALIALRALLGIAAATLMPSIMVLLRLMFPNPRQFSVAVAVTMSAFAAGMAVGPPLGGALLELFWWGAAFLANVPVAVVVLLALPLLPAHRGEESGHVDMVSVVLSLAAIIAVVFGLQEIADTYAGGSAPVWPYVVTVVVGLLLAALFVRRQLRLADPLLDLRLFATPAFTVSLLVLLLMLLALGGTDMLFAQFLQTARGLSPGHAGLLLIGPAVASIVGTALAPVLTRWMRPAYAMAGGLLAAAVGAAAMALLAGSAGLVVLVALVTVIQVALGPLFPLSTNLIVGSAPVERSGSAAAMADVGGGLGNALSLAFMGSLAAVVYRAALRGAAPEDLPDGAVSAAGESVGGATAVADGLSGAAGQELLEAAGAAFTLGVRSAYGVGAVLLVLVAVLALWRLRHARLDDGDTTEPAGDSTSDATPAIAPVPDAAPANVPGSDTIVVSGAPVALPTPEPVADADTTDLTEDRVPTPC